MSKWISGEELLDRLKIKDFELFQDYVKKGLQPYNELGKPLSPSDLMEKVTDIRSLKKEIGRIRELHDELADDIGRNEAGISYETAIKPLKEEIVRSEKRLASVRDLDWNEIEPCESEKEAKQIFAEVNKCLFKVEDVEELEKQFGLKGKIGKPHKPVSTPRKLRPVQKHKIECRKVAKRLWEEDPTITIASMIVGDELNKVCEPKVYSEETLRNWIKDLCPDRSPGRRKKTKK